eukprot:5799735-Prorocentrum_lima.AAC.1
MIAAEVESATQEPEVTPLFMAFNCDVRPDEITDDKVIVAARTAAEHTLQHSAVPLGVYMARKAEYTRTRAAVY